jgi:hypothetical protein
VLFILALACTDGSGPDSGDSTTDSQEFKVLVPTQTGVLFYHGHGGENGTASGEAAWDDAATALEGEGWTVTRRDTLGDTTAFRMIVLLDPGHYDDLSFGPGAVELLEDALSTGTRIVLTTSALTCAANSPSGLLSELGMGMALTGSPAGEPIVTEPGSTTHPAVEGVGTVLLSDPCSFTTSGAEPLLFGERDVFSAAERHPLGGDVVVVGDQRFADNTKLPQRDNLQFLLNLAAVAEE